MLSVATCAQAACLFEATARKPGNVHRYRDFCDLSYLDFLLSASALGPCLEQVGDRGVGATVLEIIRRTREVTATNTNLGITLLLTPLAAVPRHQSLQDGIEPVLQSLTVADARAVYQAIRLAQPGGLGQAPDQDVAQEPTKPLREIMLMAADRDMVARQYSNGFRELFDTGLPALLHRWQQGWPLEEAIIYCHLWLMAQFPDSLISRKRGTEEAKKAAALATFAVASADEPLSESEALHELDAWLRECGNERNPGTTADLVNACLFAALRDGPITLPLDRPWSR
jgi:triphosphoribosyl-dephospho-CoA synthase